MLLDNKAIYNTKWVDWEDMKKYGPSSRWIRKLIKKIIDGLDYYSVLDVGCGEGYELVELFKNRAAIEITGIDFSSKAIELARKKNSNCTFYTLDITKEHLPTSYDLVLCSEVLEHVEQVDATLAHIGAMTKKYLVITTPQGRMRKHEAYVGHLRNFKLQELRELLGRNHFQIKEKYEWGFPFYSPLYRDAMELFTHAHHRISEGRYGLLQKIIAGIAYYIFFLNRYYKGDQLVILAEKI